MEKIRTFVSIDLPENIQKEIKKIQDSLPSFEGKKIEPENLHLTLKFLGEIDKEKVGEVKKRLRKIKSDCFEAEIDSIGVFSENFVRIVWLHIKGPEELQKEIDNALKGIFEPEIRFMSHLTVARVKRIQNKNYFLGELKKIKIKPLKFKTDRFALKKSTLMHEGPIYETLEEYGLS